MLTKTFSKPLSRRKQQKAQELPWHLDSGAAAPSEAHERVSFLSMFARLTWPMCMCFEGKEKTNPNSNCSPTRSISCLLRKSVSLEHELPRGNACVRADREEGIVTSWRKRHVGAQHSVLGWATDTHQACESVTQLLTDSKSVLAQNNRTHLWWLKAQTRQNKTN